MKKIFLFSLSALLLLISGYVEARPLDADLTIRSIDIDHDFSGINIILFGARNAPGNIVVALRGPDKNYVVRKKERTAGIWVNTESTVFRDVESLYTLASTFDSFEDSKSPVLLSNMALGISNLDINGYVRGETPIDDFRKAFIDHMIDKKLYKSDIYEIGFWGETLFRTVLKFPKSISEGIYTAEIYLISDGELIAVQTTPIKVEKIGFEAFIYDLAHGHKLLYGVICILTALIAGWGASALFGRM